MKRHGNLLGMAGFAILHLGEKKREIRVGKSAVNQGQIPIGKRNRGQIPINPEFEAAVKACQ